MNQNRMKSILRPRMFYEALADSIRDRILEHELAPGTPIDEFQLASGYGVSRTPLREALKVLVSEGLVEHQAHHGCFVKRMEYRDVVQIFDVLELLEAFAVRQAARAGARLSEGDDFYQDVLEASGNGYLVDLTENLWVSLRQAFGPLFEHLQMKASPECLSQLRDSIEKGLEEKAVQSMADWGACRRRAGRDAFTGKNEALSRQDGTRLSRDRIPVPKQGEEGYTEEFFCAGAV